MRFTEYVVMALLLLPTASVLAAVFISLTAPETVPAESTVTPTSPAVYYADLENQP